MTKPFSPTEKKQQVLGLAADYLALGLDSEKSTIYLQSDIKETAELMWLLTTITPLGDLGRMTQFKDKSQDQPKNLNAGLLTYPILMAADILILNADVVPVGEDQLQHLELTRELARKFNSRFQKFFKEPKALLTEVPRLMSLDDPAKKMSKSRPTGCLFLDDEPAVIRKKIMSAVTDSGKEVEYDPEKKPAISNLMRIYNALTEQPFNQIEKKFKNKGYGYFKKDLAEKLIGYFASYREQKLKLLKSTSNLEKLLKTSAQKISKISDKNLLEIKKIIGLNN